MLNAVIIVGAGRGHRLGGETPKQYILIEGVCALRRAVDAFLNVHDIGPVRVVIHPDDEMLYQEAMSGISDKRLLSPVFGGITRAHSVCLGLMSLHDLLPDRVLIHDAARPFVTEPSRRRLRRVANCRCALESGRWPRQFSRCARRSLARPDTTRLSFQPHLRGASGISG